MKFSANLGFLWSELPLPAAIHAAHAAGFAAVECHWPYATPVAEVQAALAQTGLPMLGVNTRRGNVDAGENGLAALPGRAAEARAAIDEALAYAKAVGAECVHVMAGNATGADARAVFLANLAYACDAAAPDALTILIEPLNAHDAPGYHFHRLSEAAAIIAAVAAPNLALMFDCYHVGRTEGDVAAELTRYLPLIGHIQCAAVPDRGPPDQGAVDYPAIFALLAAHGWQRPIGAEYRPGGPTEASLGWMSDW